MWGLLLSVATIAWSTLLPKQKNNDTSRSMGDSSSTTSLVRGIGPEAKIFVSGIAFTVGTQFFYQWLTRNPHYKRMKFMLFSVFGGVSNKEDVPFRKPCSILNLKKQHPRLVENDSITRTEYGSTVKLVAPEMTSCSSHSSTLHVSLITIEPNCESPSEQSPPFLEFYQVVSGAGCMSQQGIIETKQFESGDAFVVDPLSVRWISNKGSNKKPLLLLRVTDGGSLYSKPAWNQLRLDPNVNYKNGGILSSNVTESVTYQTIANGLQKVQKAAADYYGSSTSGHTNNHQNNNNNNSVHFSDNHSSSSDTPKKDNKSSVPQQLHNGR